MLKIPDGTYTVSISATGYQSISASVNVTGANISKIFYLSEKSGDGGGGGIPGFEIGIVIIIAFP
jgi:hypothetical protein